ncbi:MAG: Crp/Fnr family transcriptional regulator [Desulfovibrio sp.]|jgi:CRP-like cAMP-binding protein|nr:Crp/Fnr family transcriptional regulator [Desulfovibrio sp.]
MKKFFPILQNCRLFAGIEGTDLEKLLRCLSPLRRHYKKNEFIFVMGEIAGSLGIVLSGGVHVLQEDFWGNRSIFAHIPPGGLFGEAFSCAGMERLPVSVAAAEKTEALLLDYQRILAVCPSVCAFHAGIVKNMVRMLAQKNIMLTRKIEHVTRRNIRGKLLSYLSEQAKTAGCGVFDIPFTRQELADYLSVDRSALSNELSKMREQGMLKFRKNHFELAEGLDRPG